MRRKLRSVVPLEGATKMNGEVQEIETVGPIEDKDHVSETDDESSLTKEELDDPLASKPPIETYREYSTSVNRPWRPQEFV